MTGMPHCPLSSVTVPSGTGTATAHTRLRSASPRAIRHTNTMTTTATAASGGRTLIERVGYVPPMSQSTSQGPSPCGARTPYSELRARCERLPDAPAVSDPSTELDGRGLLALVSGIAASIPDGVGRVAVVMDHSVRMVASIFAVLSRGAAYVPIEPSFPPERTAYILSDADVGAVLTDGRDVPGPDLPRIDIGRIAPSDSVPEDRSEPDGLAYILYTSGSTGAPKGVAVRNRNVLHYIDAYRAEFSPGPGDVLLQYSVCTFDIFVEEVFASLLSGAALAIPPWDVRGDVPRLMGFVEERGVTVISGFPYLLQDINACGALPPSIRLLISGGDVLRRSYIDGLLGRTVVYNTYGPSETTVCCTYHRCEGDPLPDGTYPIGRAIPGTTVEILDEGLAPVPPGEVGEICISGGGVSAGYIGAASGRNGDFVARPDGTVTYRSGDMGRLLPDGEIEFLHRKDTQVMILGRRVETEEVESVLNRIGLVRNAVVRAYSDEDGLAYMTAYVVADGDVRESELRARLADYLPDYMIPEFFVRIGGIPLNANGKLDAASLPVVLKMGRHDPRRR